jgi:hypothetical protein
MPGKGPISPSGVTSTTHAVTVDMTADGCVVDSALIPGIAPAAPA